MESIIEGKKEYLDRRSRIKQNVRVVSPKAKHKRRTSRITKSISDIDNRTSSGSSTRSHRERGHVNNVGGTSTTKYDIPQDIEILRKQIVRRASTMPNLFDSYDLKQIYEENSLRNKFRETIGIRNHTSPFVHQQHVDPSTRWKDIYRQLNVSENSVDDAVESLTEKEEKQFLEYLARKQSQSGLWKMASATAYEYKACKSHNIDDLAMAVITKQIAVKKMREKISRKMELPGDKFKRIAALRENVHFIEQKFENMKQAKPKKTSSLKNMDLYNECDASNLPSRFTRPGEVSFV